MKIVRPKIMFCYESVIEVLQEAAKQENINAIFVVTDSDKILENVLTLKDVLNSSNISDEDINNYEPKSVDDLDNDIAFLLFTSGTSGFPKAVSHSYTNLLNYQLTCEDYEIGRDTRTLWYSAPLANTHLLYFCRSIMAQATRIFRKAFDVDESLKVIEKYKVFKIFRNIRFKCF